MSTMWDHALATEVAGVVVNEGFLLRLRTGHMMCAAGDMIVMFRADGVTRTGWHLDWGHHWTHIVMVRTQLTMVMVAMVGMVLTPHWTDH